MSASVVAQVHLLSVKGLTKHFRAGPSLPLRLSRVTPTTVVAVNNVTFNLSRSEILGIAGESGSGKSTMGYCITRLIEPDAGEIIFADVDILTLDGRALRDVRRRIQMVFQNPYSSLNPRMSIGDAILEAGRVHHQLGTSTPDHFVRDRLDQVRLPGSYGSRRPRDLSGGQRQRAAVARALATGPEIIIADEAVSALDVSIQTEIVNLFLDLRDEIGLSIIFISHQLPVLAACADRIAVMKSGAVVEIGATRDLLQAPQHSYTQGLLAAHPHPKFFKSPNATDRATNETA